MKGLLLLLSLGMVQSIVGSEVRLITLDPGHFHASLVQKFMYPQVSPIVQVYAPEGPDLREHLARIARFNARPDNPTCWQEQVHTGADFLDAMVREKAGNVAVISGNNSRKTEYIERALQAGFHVLADKPMAISSSDFDRLQRAFAIAAENHLLLYDIMTERHEIASQLQRALARVPELFGVLEEGTPEKPAVIMESVHYFFKEVAGKPLQRPAWFFDVRQEGEAIPDVGTHLVDLVQWICFPEQPLDWRRDIQVLRARRWSTPVSREQFQRATGVAEFPAFLRGEVGPEDVLNVYQNGEVVYRIRGVYARVTALWKSEPPVGATDSHYSRMSGTRANLTIRQGPDQDYRPTLYIESKTGSAGAEFETHLRQALAELMVTWPGLGLRREGKEWAVVAPEKYYVGHEAHFAQVTQDFLRFLEQGKLPAWEVPNMLAKYYTTTEAQRLASRAAEESSPGGNPARAAAK